MYSVANGLLTRHIPRLLARKEGDEGSDLVRLSDASQGGCRAVLYGRVRFVCRQGAAPLRVRDNDVYAKTYFVEGEIGMVFQVRGERCRR